MHIEPGLVDGAKIALSYATAVASAGLAAKMVVDTARTEGGAAVVAARSVVTTLLVFCFFQVLPHHPAGVSEVHLILGSTLYLMFGGGPAAVGLALGLLAQGALFEPADLPQYGMNVTTLIAPLYVMGLLAKRIVKPGTRYADLGYGQALKLSATYQGGIVAWVAFWAFYGQGFGAAASVASFGLAYMAVVVFEPLIDLAVLAAAKSWTMARHPLFERRLTRMA